MHCVGCPPWRSNQVVLVGGLLYCNSTTFGSFTAEAAITGTLMPCHARQCLLTFLTLLPVVTHVCRFLPSPTCQPSNTRTRGLLLLLIYSPVRHRQGESQALCRQVSHFVLRDELLYHHNYTAPTAESGCRSFPVIYAATYALPFTLIRLALMQAH